MAIRRLQNDVAIIEDTSDRKIPFGFYYIVKIGIRSSDHIPNTIWTPQKLLRKTFGSDGSPISVYENYFGATPGGENLREIYLLFSCLENGNHYLAGSQQKICSEFVTEATLEYKTHVTCSIIEFDSRTKIQIYFQTKMYEFTLSQIRDIIKNMSDHDDFSGIKESLEFIKKNAKKHGISPNVWETTDPERKYGVFYKILNADGEGKKKIAKFSSFIDLENIDAFSNYLFG